MSPRPVVALLESRMSRELARLVEKHGGDSVGVPAVKECPEFTPELANKLIDELSGDRHEVVVFMTGVAVSLLFEMAEQIGRRPDLVAALRRLTTVCRGPKPTAALRGFGVPPTLSAREPFTSADVIDALSGIELKGRRVILLHYGERSETLAETLLARQARVEELWLYRWLMPDDTTGLANIVKRIIAGDVDALAITCQIQFRHLHEVAARAGLAEKMVRALNDRVVVAAVGPTCEAILHAYGVRVHVMPDHPKMGPLVVALMRYLERGRSTDSSSAELAPVSN
ncbi:MAG TPA: uroporphyrinogen-III synthase [Polyangiaceae bacterium]|nr:uroporphyrinogen-III synthase [Polyangiaceae bacterium]